MNEHYRKRLDAWQDDEKAPISEIVKAKSISYIIDAKRKAIQKLVDKHKNDK